MAETADPPEDVLENLEFLLDFDLVENLDILDTAAFEIDASTSSVKSSTMTYTIQTSTETVQ